MVGDIMIINITNHIKISFDTIKSLFDLKTSF